MIVNTANKCKCCQTLKKVERVELISPNGMTTSGLAFESEQMIVTNVDAWSSPHFEREIFFDDGSTRTLGSLACSLYDDTQQAV